MAAFFSNRWAIQRKSESRIPNPMASAQVSQASLKIFMQVAQVLYISYCGYFLSAGFAYRIFYLHCSNYLSFYTQMLGRAVNPWRKPHKGCRLGSCAALPRDFCTPAPGTAKKWLILHQFYSPTVRHVLWQCSPHTIIHPLCLIQVPVTLQGAEMRSNYNIGSYFNL